MAKLTSRWYRNERDLKRMLALVTASAMRDGPNAGHLHVGDVVWGLFQNPTIDPAARIRLFDDGRGALRGFVWLHPPRGFGIHVNTAMPIFPAMIVEMVQWAEAHLKATNEDGEPLGPFEIEEVPSLDMPLHAGLKSAGYRSTSTAAYCLYAQMLDVPIPELVLPPGAMVRSVRFDDPAEIDARVALHREVWEPSRFTADGYARLRAKPVYRPDLDLIAVTSGGELASYCIVWWDPETRTGEFEPVGTALNFRSRGFGKALLLDALHRLKAMGGRNAVVVSETRAEGEPARRLYEAVGFHRVLDFEEWERKLP